MRLDYVANVMFLIDSSQMSNIRDFKRQKDFTKIIARLLNLQQGRSRAGVLSFGNVAETSIAFGQYSDVFEFNRAMDLIPMVGGERRLDKALKKALVAFSKDRCDLKENL